MSIWLEEKIKNALLSVRWEQVGEGTSPKYFMKAQPNFVKVNNITAAWLANFIANHVTYEDSAINDDFDKHSLEVIASYLEDHGYVVSCPD
ncbi:MAG: hypothetical protein FD167_3692 [bacterium]|nr:MAG: hypothetical protein FD167_3692 [bacterium]